MANSSYDIAVVGMSHLGLVTALSLASLGKSILCLDLNQEIINQLLDQKIPVYEPGLSELLSQFKKNLLFTSNFKNLSKTATVFFSQDTATDGSGSVEKLDQFIAHSIPNFKKNTTIVCMSQVPLGYYRKAENKIRVSRPNLNFHLYHMVDTIIMTNAIERFIHPERIIIGKNNPQIKSSQELENFLSLFKCPVFFMNYESAELTKAAVNLYLANCVTFANTLSDYCEVSGANIHDIIPALQTDKRIGHFAYLRPTLRIAGGHLERDLFMLKRLAQNKGTHSGVVKWIIKMNKDRYLWALEQLKQHLFSKVKKPTICIWGLSYKKNTDSTKNAPSLKIIKELKNKANLRLYDPMAILPKSLQKLERFSDKYLALENADCLLILTEWDEFQKIHLKKLANLKQKLLIDCVGILHSQKTKLPGINYLGMGVGTVIN